MTNAVASLRTIALIEGVSYLVLLFLAMPLKYFWGLPQAVRIVGMAHGVLFVIFCVALLYTSIIAKWPLGRSALIFLAAIFPFGPWLVDGKMKKYEADHLKNLPAEKPHPARRS